MCFFHFTHVPKICPKSWHQYFLKCLKMNKSIPNEDCPHSWVQKNANLSFLPLQSQVTFCCNNCMRDALNSYHQILAPILGQARLDPRHPFNVLQGSFLHFQFYFSFSLFTNEIFGYEIGISWFFLTNCLTRTCYESGSMLSSEAAFSEAFLVSSASKILSGNRLDAIRVTRALIEATRPPICSGNPTGKPSAAESAMVPTVAPMPAEAIVKVANLVMKYLYNEY